MSPRSGSRDEREWKTRKERIDPRLDSLGWKRAPQGRAAVRPFRTEEEPTDDGPADYALWLNGKDLVGVVEAKKVTIGPQGVLTQAERYARSARSAKYDFDGLRVPFLYSTNGEVAIYGNCWANMGDVKPPCGRRTFRYGDKCYRPVAADPGKPIGPPP